MESYSLEVRHAEGSEPITSQQETTNTRWSVVRPLWNAVYNVTLRVKIAGVALDWALYTVRAKLDCPGGQRRCHLNGAGQLFGRQMHCSSTVAHCMHCTLGAFMCINAHWVHLWYRGSFPAPQI